VFASILKEGSSPLITAIIASLLFELFFFSFSFSLVKGDQKEKMKLKSG